eukprot:4421-Heterococcus_DN1.PRE.2
MEIYTGIDGTWALSNGSAEAYLWHSSIRQLRLLCSMTAPHHSDHHTIEHKSMIGIDSAATEYAAGRAARAVPTKAGH